jgi:hypothetical protein
LLETKGFNDFGLDSLLVAVAWSCGEADAKLVFDEVCEGLWRFEHDPVGLVDKDQRVLLWFKIATNVVFNLIFTSSQAPKVLKISSVSFH